MIHPSEIRHGFDDDEKEAIDKKEKKPVGTNKKYIIHYMNLLGATWREGEKGGWNEQKSVRGGGEGGTRAAQVRIEHLGRVW